MRRNINQMTSDELDDVADNWMYTIKKPNGFSEWLDEHCIGDYLIFAEAIHFERQEDYMMYKLRWE